MFCLGRAAEVKGQACNGLGPLEGVGLTDADEVWVRDACSLELARANGVQGSVPVQVSLQGANLYMSMGVVDDTVPAGNYFACWCSSKGPNCSTMNFSESSTDTTYLEHVAATLVVEGPASGAEVECFVGSECSVQLPVEGAQDLKPGDTATALELCGLGSFLRGLPLGGVALTADGHAYAWQGTGSQYLESDPGFFRLCWCRPSDQRQCNETSDFNVNAGLFIATGPYANQRFSCIIGARCILQGADLRGIQLGAGDSLVTLASCDSFVLSTAFPVPLPLAGTVNGTTYYFDFGDVQATVTPELVHVCWCSARSSSCHRLSGFRRLATELSLECGPGWFELPTTLRECHPCPIGYYCPGGWQAPLNACPVGSTAPAQSASLEQCLCRRGFHWDASTSTCVSCPSGVFKDIVSRATSCQSPCPSQTTSSLGAAKVSECTCAGEALDTNPAIDEFTCTTWDALADNSSDSQQMFAAFLAPAVSFEVTFDVSDASTAATLLEVRQQITRFLELSDSASLFLEARFNSSGWYVDAVISSSELELAQQLHNRFDTAVFNAWVLTQSGTALESAKAFREDVATVNVSCPTGLGFPAGSAVKDLSDCKCPHGKQPAVLGSTGLAVSCTSCTVGKYKATVGDTACVSCAASLTTLQTGAVSPRACTFICAPGYYAPNSRDPSNCQPCGEGFYCSQSRRLACDQNKTTALATASTVAECMCAPGFRMDAEACTSCPSGKSKSAVADVDCTQCAAGTYATEGEASCTTCTSGSYSLIGAAACEPCPSGRYLQTAGTSVEACVLCAIGSWSSAPGAASPATCQSCLAGSTTARAGANASHLCAQPNTDHNRSCISGRMCQVDGISGNSLEVGHRLAVASACPANAAVDGISNSGISKSARQAGSQYIWGDSFKDFTPLGGSYSLCWCAGMQSLECDRIGANFILRAGLLVVTGPFYHDLTCLRGADCLNLTFDGSNLLVSDQVAVRQHACGGSTASRLSKSNSQGLGSLQPNGAGFYLTFGESNSTSSNYISIDATSTGYYLCWCASQRGSQSACSKVEDFAVLAGRLRVLGPYEPQENACAVGRDCSVTGLRGVQLRRRDRLMLLSDCGEGSPIARAPQDGILDTVDGRDFYFQGTDHVLLSVPGIYRLCFCRPGVTSCLTPADFTARVGFTTVSGPFEQTTVCDLGGNCTIPFFGVGLQEGDRLALTRGACGTGIGLGERGYPELQEPLTLMNGVSGPQVELGELPAAAHPGLFSICWSTKDANGTQPGDFKANAGQLQVDCPPGTFAVGPESGQTCERCTKGFYCQGGRPATAARVECASGRTTLATSSAAQLLVSRAQSSSVAR